MLHFNLESKTHCNILQTLYPSYFLQKYEGKWCAQLKLNQRPALWLDSKHIDVKPSSAEEAFIALARRVWQNQNATGKRQLSKQLREFVSDGSRFVD